MTKHVMKSVRIVCNGCHATKTALVWQTNVEGHYVELCECGGAFAEAQHDLKPVEGAIGDDIPGGMVMEHLYPGRKVYSHTEHRAVIEEYNKANGTKWRLSDYGWVGVRDQHLKRESGYADLRTKEERVAQMAEFLGLTVEEYHRKFDAPLDSKPKGCNSHST